MKPGIKTTEFWATLIGSITVAGASELGLNLNEASVASIAAMVITYVVGRVMNKNTQAKIDQKSWNVMPLWLSALLQALRDLMQPFLAYMLGKEQLRRKQAEENLELQESYEKLDEQNKSYRDRGKSGLLERLRKSRKSADK